MAAAVNWDAGEREYQYRQRQLVSQLYDKIYGGEISVSDVKEKLEDYKLNINALTFDNRTLLYLGIRLQNEELVKLFLEHGADPNMKSAFDEKHSIHLPIVGAIDLKNEEIAKMLIDYGARVPLPGSRNLLFLDDSLNAGPENYDDPEDKEDVKETQELYRRLVQYAATKNKNQRRLMNSMRNKFETKVGGPNVVKLIGKYAGMGGGKTKKRTFKKRKTMKRK